MRITGQHSVPFPVEQVWDALLDRVGQHVGAGDLHQERSCRRVKRSEGEIGIAVIAKPSASEIADANTAADGITPASPAPLMPSGLSGDGV